MKFKLPIGSPIQLWSHVSSAWLPAVLTIDVDDDEQTLFGGDLIYFEHGAVSSNVNVTERFKPTYDGEQPYKDVWRPLPTKERDADAEKDELLSALNFAVEKYQAAVHATGETAKTETMVLARMADMLRHDRLVEAARATLRLGGIDALREFLLKGML